MEKTLNKPKRFERSHEVVFTSIYLEVCLKSVMEIPFLHLLVGRNDVEGHVTSSRQVKIVCYVRTEEADYLFHR